LSVELVLPPSAVLFAAHLALIAAASCARRSGERFSFFFGFFVRLGFFALARAADFLAAFNAFADSASCSLRLNFASFCGPSCKRFSSSWIFFFNFFSFIFVLPLAPTANFKDWGFELMTKFRRCHAILWQDARLADRWRHASAPRRRINPVAPCLLL